MRQKLILMRGLPGSGKTTTAERIFNEEEDAYIASADSYFLDEGGVYNFERKELPLAHTACFLQAVTAIKAGIAVVIVDNTNVCRRDMENYLAFAELRNASGDEFMPKVDVKLLEPDCPRWHTQIKPLIEHPQGRSDTRWGEIMDFLEVRNTHGVPASAIDRMAKRWEPTSTIELKLRD